MVKLGLTDVISDITGGIVPRKHNSHATHRLSRIEDVTVNGIIYYRCVERNV